MPQTALEETELTESIVGDAPKSEPDPEENEEFEVFIEDDTPEEDRERDPMPEAIVDDLENDELEEYSAEKTKQLKRFGMMNAEQKKQQCGNVKLRLLLPNK